MRTPAVAFGVISFTIATTLATLISCGGDDQGSLGPATGALRVTTESGGIGADPDGYVLRLDDATEGPIGDPAPVVLTGLAGGDHTIALDNVVSFCAVDGGPSRTVAVPAGDTADVAFAVTCRATGGLGISVSTTGGTLDPDGYAVNLDGHLAAPIGPNGTLRVPDLVIGSHVVALSGLAFNCQASGGITSSVTVSLGAETSVPFTISCSKLAPWQVLYQSWRPGPDHGQYDLFKADVESGGVTQLTQNVYDDMSPTLSPDRTRVAFLFTDANEDFRLAVMNVDGTSERTLTPDPVRGWSAHAWSPDGSMIAFAREELSVINLDGTGERQLGPYEGPFSWSPDGKRIATLRNGDIWVVPLDGGPSASLTHSYEAEVEAVWSPDGRRLAFTRRTIRPGNFQPYTEDIWVMDSDGSDQRRLTESSGALDYAGSAGPRWSPDGQLILFHAYRDGTYESDLYTIRPDGSGRTNLTNTPDVAEGAANWSPEGDKIVFAGWPVAQGVGGADVFVINADGSGRKDLSNYYNMDMP